MFFLTINSLIKRAKWNDKRFPKWGLGWCVLWDSLLNPKLTIGSSPNVTLFQTKKNPRKRQISRAQTGAGCQPSRIWLCKNWRGDDAASWPAQQTIDKPTSPSIVLPQQASKAGSFRPRAHCFEFWRCWIFWEKTNFGISLFIACTPWLWLFKGAKWLPEAILRMREILFRSLA